ncbi:MAG: isoprenyl transferase [Salinivirgaceae bacterium]|nr:isoprenyl transferase [Salinivirgaceae bacterium]
MSLKESIIKERLPRHIAIIMDGNGRWAKKQGNARIFGHKNALNAVRAVCEGCAELGVGYLTLYAFSTENWNRPKMEVSALMDLLVSAINTETDTLIKNNIRLNAIGRLTDLPEKVCANLREAIDRTKANTGLTLTLALSYSSKVEIIEAVRRIANDVADGKIAADAINGETVSQNLYTCGIPDPDLLIRTSGEYRISNFMLWQLAYAELYFTPTLWPDFDKEELYKAIVDYQQRERRFGMTSEQLGQSI